MDQKDTIKFYDSESAYYTLKRYEVPMTDFTQFYFRKRLSIVLQYIKQATKGEKDLDLLEVGCADGVVMQKIERKFPHTFKKMTGTDISPKMIEEAKKKNTVSSHVFFVRGQEGQNQSYDFILEVGFLTTPLLKNEFYFVSERLKKDGYFICSLSLKYSLRMFFKSEDDSYKQNHLSISEYEKLLRERFIIVNKETYGLFVPKLWAFPRLARALQPMLDLVFKHVVPEIFHERIYLLQNNTNRLEA